ncbi:MAG: indole-3-glycerol phosphate synthase TrpC [Clostridia bacterium]|nr:indole-3-glycerol phosphate synthase TrpC [Clostridia bacterium]
MILDTLAQSTRNRVENEKKTISPEQMKTYALSMPKMNFEFEKALRKDDIAFICEVKKASPSKGIIAEDFPYVQIAKDYETAGASAVSVLTEPEYFKGSTEYLSEISKNINIPIIRKDFTVDEYMIYQARMIGASAVLLICAILDTETIKKYISRCDTLGLSALVEAHDEDEIHSALKAGARLIGVNNRNLKDFTVDINNCVNLRKLVPSDITFVAESGIKTAKDIDVLRKANVNAVLIGETLMRAENKTEMLARLKGKK